LGLDVLVLLWVR